MQDNVDAKVATMAPNKELQPHPTIPKSDKPVLVCILDGWGENVAKDKFNAIHVANTPTTDALKVHMTTEVRPKVSPVSMEHISGCSSKMVCQAGGARAVADGAGAWHSSWLALRCGHGQQRGWPQCPG